MLAYLPFAVLALVLGFKHSYDADHLIAVSNILRKAASLKCAVRMGIHWAAGHMMTAAIMVSVLYFSRDFLAGFLPHLEKIVGAMLILLGILSIKAAFHSHEHSHGSAIHSHPHLHATDSHMHRHIFSIGIVQGLAGNDELLLLLTASLGVTTLGGMLAGTAIFSIGVILGMVSFAALFSFPLLRLHGNAVHRCISYASGAAGIVYGAAML